MSCCSSNKKRKWGEVKEAELQAIIAAANKKQKKSLNTAYQKQKKAADDQAQKDEKRTSCLLVFITPDPVEQFTGYQKPSDALAAQYFKDWNIKQYHMQVDFTTKQQLYLLKVQAEEEEEMKMYREGIYAD